MDALEFSRIAKALADPRRLEILELLVKQGKLNCTAIVEQLPVSQPTVSHHIKELINANLIEAHAKGQCHYLKLRSEVVKEYTRELQKRLGCVESAVG
jgi:DNA-binding transcriptional ArsR family regulator